MMIIHNETLLGMIKNHYKSADIAKIRHLLERRETFYYPKLSNGLFPAANIADHAGAVSVSGYSHIWVRDNIYIAYAHHINGKSDLAAKTVQTLAKYFTKFENRFQDIINEKTDPNLPMDRPHVKFNGDTLDELKEEWAHAQNDALGYFVWLHCLLARDKKLETTLEDMELLVTFVNYFKTISFWRDEDSGHWEETRKIEASSIGVVTGALIELKKLVDTEENEQFAAIATKAFINTISWLIDRGTEALEAILPHESIQNGNKRDYDAALLFLIYPIRVIHGEIADRILANVMTTLQGDYGIRRYLGDSYWCADYKKYLPPEKRTVDFSRNIESRNAFSKKEGEEAQWCIFDPIISAIYGERFHKTWKREDLDMQIKYLNRSLGQLTGEASAFGGFKCPEAYYLEDGRYVPNDHTPLLWTQANLWVALKILEDNLRLLEK